MKNILSAETAEKLNSIRNFMRQQSLDAVFYTSAENVFYVSGFTGYGDADVLITEKDQFIITDFRYTEQVAEECPDFELIDGVSENMDFAAGIMCENNIKTAGFEDETILHRFITELKESAPEIDFKGIGNFTENLRRVKSKSELDTIEKSCAISSEAFAETYEKIEEGMTEREAAALLEYNMRKHGADGEAFATIVASGIRSSMCHGTATDKKLSYKDPVTVDFGAKYKGYCADMTRTFFIGKADEKMREIYNIVFEAQQLALEKIKPGMTGREADAVARDYITSKGYGKYFGHGLGHGVGIMIHELPRVSVRRDDILAEGMVFSVEPGIYIPGLGGVRIEDLVCIRDGKLKVMTSFEKSLLVK